MKFMTMFHASLFTTCREKENDFLLHSLIHEFSPAAPAAAAAFTNLMVGVDKAWRSRERESEI
jgi:hypothetical protein